MLPVPTLGLRRPLHRAKPQFLCPSGGCDREAHSLGLGQILRDPGTSQPHSHGHDHGEGPHRAPGGWPLCPAGLWLPALPRPIPDPPPASRQLRGPVPIPEEQLSPQKGTVSLRRPVRGDSWRPPVGPPQPGRTGEGQGRQTTTSARGLLLATKTRDQRCSWEGSPAGLCESNSQGGCCGGSSPVISGVS